MTLGLLLALAGTLPQQQGTAATTSWESRPVLAHSGDARNDKFAPVVDASNFALRATTLAAGLADLEGNGERDAWFLDEWFLQSVRTRGVSVQMNKSAGLGRFTGWPLGSSSLVTGRQWTDGSTSFGERERVVLCDPTHDHLSLLFFQRTNASKPREGQLTYDDQLWQVGLGAYEVEARDLDGDGHDDIAMLVAGPNGSTLVQKLRMKVNLYSTLMPDHVVTGSVPVRLERLRMIDLDADGRDDVVAFAPGYGLVTLRDDGNRAFQWHELQYLPAGVSDVLVGDLDGDGREDYGASTDLGAIVYASAGGASRTPRVAFRPQGVGPLAGGAIFDADADGQADLVVFAQDCRNFAIHAWVPGSVGFASPRVVSPPSTQLQEYLSTAGVSGQAMVVGDLDNDGDEDVLLQMGTAAEWITLRNPLRRLAPTGLVITHEGMIGETGVLKERLTVSLPAPLTSDLLGEIEAAFYVQDPVTKAFYLFRERLVEQPKPGQTTISFLVYYQRDPAKVAEVLAQDPFARPGGIGVAGDVFVSIHGKKKGSAGAAGARYESLMVHHLGGGDEQKSALGVKWEPTAAPPMPTTDNALLPWN